MAFDPVTLFASGEVGAIYDAQTIGSMFQDSAGTTPAVIDSPVGRINDLSGNANHALQATAGKRPMLRNSGGANYLDFDGIDDFLRATFTITQPITRVSLIDIRTWVDGQHMLSGAASFGGALYKSPALPQLRMYDGTAVAASADGRVPENTPAIANEVHNSASSSFGFNQDTVITNNPGILVPGGITMGATFLDAATQGGLRIYGLVMINRLLTATDRDNVQSWLTRPWARVVVVDGDSNTYATTSYGYQFVPNASPFVFFQNLAIAGTGLDSNANDLTTVARLANIDGRIPVDKRGRQYVYFPWWSNNLGSDTADDIAAFLAGRKAAGWDKVGVGTFVERTDAGQDNTAFRLALNATIRAAGWIQSKGIDFLVDFASDPDVGIVGASTNTTYFETDLVHLTAAGSAKLEVIFRAALNALPLFPPHHRSFMRRHR